MSANVSTARATSPDVRPATMADREAVVRALARLARATMAEID